MRYVSVRLCNFFGHNVAINCNFIAIRAFWTAKAAVDVVQVFGCWVGWYWQLVCANQALCVYIRTSEVLDILNRPQAWVVTQFLT
jgi:hypothetical protein